MAIIKTCVILCRFQNNDGSAVAIPAPQNFYTNYFFTPVFEVWRITTGR